MSSGLSCYIHTALKLSPFLPPTDLVLIFKTLPNLSFSTLINSMRSKIESLTPLTNWFRGWISPRTMVTGTQVRIQFGSLKKMSQNERRKTCRYEKLVTTISAQGVILHIIYNTTLTFKLRKLHFWRSLQKLLKTNDLAYNDTTVASHLCHYRRPSGDLVR